MAGYVRPQHGSWEPGASLRAEVRRLRSQQIQLMGIMSQFLEVLGAPEDLLLRLAALLSSLDQHKQLDARNGFHAHNHGDALRAAASELSKEDYERMLGIKKKGDAARHAPFYVQSQPVSDVFQYLEGMCLQQPASVAGGTLWASWSAPCDGCGDSLANAAAAERAVQSQLVDSVKIIIRTEEARPVFEVDGFVIVDPGGCLARVIRIGHSNCSQEVRVASRGRRVDRWPLGLQAVVPASATPRSVLDHPVRLHGVCAAVRHRRRHVGRPAPL